MPNVRAKPIAAMFLSLTLASCSASRVQIEGPDTGNPAGSKPAETTIKTIKPGQATAAIPGFKVFMRVELHPAKEVGQRDILPNAALHSGDRFRVVAWATEQVYVYLVSYDPQGWSELNFPRGQHVQLPANAPLSVPDRGALFKVNDKSGDGELILFASRKPLDKDTADKLRLPWPLWNPDGTRGGNEGRKKEPPPPPPPSSLG